MATTNHTPHYNLPQWATGDKVGILANLNPAFDTIDSNLFEAVTNSEAAVNTANSASQVATSVNQAVNELQPDVLKNRADISTLQNLVNSDHEIITSTENYTGTLNSAILDGGTINCRTALNGLLLSIFGWSTIKNIAINIGTTIASNLAPIPSERKIYGICTISYTGSDGKFHSHIGNAIYKTNGTLVADFTETASTGKSLYINAVLLL